MDSVRVEFSDKGFALLRDMIGKAQKYIYVASFLFYDEELADLLMNKSKAGVDTEILTTPAEAAGTDELKAWATDTQESLRSSGVQVVACKWEVGQPQRTTATFAGGRQPTWFALHTKFVVTDKHAIIMSADLTRDFHESRHWDSFVIYDDQVKIQSLRGKYQYLKRFCADIEHHVPKEYIDTTVKSRALVRGYPFRDTEPSVVDGFSILPIDAYGRRILEKIIESSDKFIYCVYETFYDDLLNFRILKKLVTSPLLDFRLITPPLTVYQQNPLKARANFVQLASHRAQIRSLGNVRAKMMITDKAVVSGSFDLSVMGIGRSRAEKGLKLWVESTEILDINTDPAVISAAASSFLELFGKASEQYAKWFEKDAENSLRSAGAKLIANEARERLGLLIFDAGQQANQRIGRISLIAVEIAKLKSESRPHVTGWHINAAEQILLHEERGELNSECLKAILGRLEVSDLLERVKRVLSARR